MNNSEKSIAAGVEELGQTLPEGGIEKLARLLSELSRWAKRINLTAIRDEREMVSGHVLDSLSVRPWLHGGSVIDIGTGAGFPGLPLAIAEPRLRFVLLDSNGRKTAFVKHMIADLGLGNVTAVQSRAETYQPQTRFDTVIARAVASVAEITRLSADLVAENGVLLAQKGKYPAEELEELATKATDWNFRVIELQVPGLAPKSRHVVRLSRNGSA
ncbi:MAG: 16S rRNA (guanine(527)-N(7))-methyltransferase RsmG [Woeseiaceae bacterium]